MKTKIEILRYYGQCCVSEFCLEKMEYPESPKGKSMAKRDDLKNSDILGQKKAIEFILGE